MSHPNASQLQALIVQANLADVASLAKYSGVAIRQIYRLQQGLIYSMPVEDVVRLAQYFDQSVDEFLAQFLPNALHPIAFTPKISQTTDLTELEALKTQLNQQATAHAAEIAVLATEGEALKAQLSQQAATYTAEIETLALEGEALKTQLSRQVTDHAAEIETLKAEYQHLEARLTTQTDSNEAQWQQAALDILESWLLQWSAAASAAQDNPHFPAKTLVSLAKPFDQLLESWQVIPFANIGEEVAYDPQKHQLVHGDFTVQPGDIVTIQNVGYQQGDRLLHRAKVINKQ